MRLITIIFATTTLAQYCKPPPSGCQVLNCNDWYPPGPHGLCFRDDGKPKCPGTRLTCCRSQLDAAPYCY
nr:uncharacterized protein CTRU02_12991 [Colletotrichum truncatum]KAF6783975.1 hypothetical protein CTRU02_12991 [Colletotrichum truncatum]